jgi:hypothetical protein
MEQIDRDVMRTHPDMHFFSGDTPEAERHRTEMKRALFMYAKLNPGLRYIQVGGVLGVGGCLWGGEAHVGGGWGMEGRRGCMLSNTQEYIGRQRDGQGLVDGIKEEAGGHARHTQWPAELPAACGLLVVVIVSVQLLLLLQHSVYHLNHLPTPTCCSRA